MAKKKKQKPPQPINNPHDKFFKAVFGMLIVVQDYLKHFFPKHLLQKLDISTLELVTTSYITPELSESYSDIVWRCQYVDKQESAHICFVFEHKSYIPDFVRIQIGDYKQGAYNKQLKSGQPLSLVLPIIVYHGVEKWSDKPFTQYFGDIDAAFHPFIDAHEYYLTDLQDYSDEMIKAFNMIFLGRTFLALKHFAEKEYIKGHFAELLFLGYENNNSKNDIDFVRLFYVYLSRISGGISVEELDIQAEKIENNQNKEIMENYIDILLERGEKRGIEKGIEKGKKLAIFEAYQRGGDLELLSRLFDMPPDAILQIIEEMNKNEKQRGNSK